jgi:hypothetical protein
MEKLLSVDVAGRVYRKTSSATWFGAMTGYKSSQGIIPLGIPYRHRDGLQRQALIRTCFLRKTSTFMIVDGSYENSAIYKPFVCDADLNKIQKAS